jgi:hypothetical protein
LPDTGPGSTRLFAVARRFISSVTLIWDEKSIKYRHGESCTIASRRIISRVTSIWAEKSIKYRYAESCNHRFAPVYFERDIDLG